MLKIEHDKMSKLTSDDGHPIRSNVIITSSDVIIAGFVDVVTREIVRSKSIFTEEPIGSRFDPRFVITNISSNQELSPKEAIKTSRCLSNPGNWMQAFLPAVVSEKEIDITDIGALNIIANIEGSLSGFGERIDTKADDFKMNDLSFLIAAMISNTATIVIDCPLDGDKSQYDSEFQRNDIWRSDIIHNGYWTDKNGNKRDLRDIDYIAVCNLVGKKSQHLILEWRDTFDHGYLKHKVDNNLLAREKLITQLTDNTAVFTGFSRRVGDHEVT